MYTDKQHELAWASGFFEGEGCFGFSRYWAATTQQLKVYPIASLANTSTEMVYRFYQAVGFGTITKHQPKYPGAKPVWTWRTSGVTNVTKLRDLLLSGLGPERLARAAEIIHAAEHPGSALPTTRKYDKNKAAK